MRTKRRIADRRGLQNRGSADGRPARIGLGGTAGLVPVLILILFPLPARVAAADDGAKPSGVPVTYHGHVEAIVKERCLGCHGGEKPKGQLSMESLEDLLEGGRKGEPLVAGHPSESLLFQLITGAGKPVMPPEMQGTLTADEIAVFRAWILDGLKAGEKQAVVAPYSVPLATPVYRRAPAVTALAYDQGGRNLYVTGYKEILVYEAEPERAPAGYPIPIARLLGEAESIHALQLSPDGALLAAAGGSPARFGELQLWDTGSHALARFVRLGSDCLYALSFSASGDRLAVAGTDRAVYELDVKTGETVYSSEIHSDWIFGVAFSADGTRLASAGRDRTVKVSAADDGKFLQNLATMEGPVMRVVQRPGSQQFLIGAESHQAILYDAQEMKEVRKLEEQPGAVLAAAISGDGKLVAVGGDASEVRVYESDDGKRKLTLTGSSDWIYALAFRPDGRRLATSGYEGLVRIYEIGEGREVRSFPAVPIGRFRRF